MALRALPQATPTVIQQQITSGNFFDGSMPAGNAVADASNGLYKYAPATAGGLFLWTAREPIMVTQLLVDLGGNGSVTVKVVNLDPATIDDAAPAVLAGEALTIEAVTAVPRLVLHETNLIIALQPFQAIQLITTASAAAQIAQCSAFLARKRIG